jgi:hypothetical protein
MGKKEYIYEPTATSIVDYGDGRLKLEYGRTSESIEEVHEQAMWIAGTLNIIRQDHDPKIKFRLLADLKKLYKISLDDRARALYKALIEQPYIERVACVGDAFSFTKVLTLSVLLVGKRKKFRFFFAIPDARKWLKW